MTKTEDYTWPKPHESRGTEITKLPNNDFGFSKLESEVPTPDYETKFNKLKQMIMPLLNNLKKNPEKDIHWPDREEKIEEFIKKIQEL